MTDMKWDYGGEVEKMEASSINGMEEEPRVQHRRIYICPDDSEIL
jgi:hypothetical protein